MTFPLRYVHGNLLFGPRGERAALYRVDTVSYPFLPNEAKRDWMLRLAGFAHAAEADFSMWRVCRAFPVDRYVDNAMPLLDGNHNPESWRTYLEGHRARLEGMAAFTPEIYLAVSLGTPRPSRRAVSTYTTAIHSRLRPNHAPIHRRDIERLLETEAHVHHRTSGFLPIRRATTRELQWLLRRTATRGVCEPMIDDYWAPVAIETDGKFQPLETELWRCANAPLAESERSLVVEADEARSHQAMFALGAVPETMTFPGQAELLCLPLEATPFPVDVAVHVRWLHNRDAGKTVRTRVLDADNAFVEQASSAHGALSFTVEENRHLARELDAYLQSAEHPPLLRATVGFAVGASDTTTLERRIEGLRQRYGQITLHRPLGLQARLFMDHLPRADGGTVWDYQDVFTIEQFGALMMPGTHDAGSRRGPYIGHVARGGRRPILLDSTEASREGRPPSMLFAGTLGSGKTVAAELVAYQAERRGSVVVTLDPQGTHNLAGLPELEGRVHTIELLGDERYQGLLDPLVIAPEAYREDLAHSYLMGLLPPSPPTWETHIVRAIKTALADPHPSCLRVLAILGASDDPDARAAGAALAAWSDSGIARLGFGTGMSRNGHHRTWPVTTISTTGLALPGPNVSRGNYDSQERVAVATLKLVAAYAMRLIQGNRSTHKVIVFDEAWFLLGTNDGRRLLDRLNRMGRAENATLILATQQLGDVGEIEGLIGTRLVFGQETPGEARRALKLLGLDPEDNRLVDRVRSFRRGRCLMRDVNDRIAEIQIDVVYPRLLQAWDTTPGARSNLVRAA